MSVFMRIIAVLAIIFLFGSANALGFGDFCTNLFTGNSVQQGLITASTYSGLISFSLLIVLLVLSVLSIVYAFGIGFGIDSLKKFAKTEYIESFFNIFLIVVVAAGLGFAGGAIGFIASIGATGINTPININLASAHDVYLAICQNYLNDVIYNVAPAVISISATLIVLSALVFFNVNLAPGDFGFSYRPFAGMLPLTNLFGLQLDFFLLLIGVMIGISLFLSLVYFLFPLFLYSGVLLRSFPWTRAAGGTLIALFVSFYIVFPALLYPFSVYFASPTFSGLQINQLSTLTFSVSGLFQVVPLSTFISCIPTSLNICPTSSPILNEIISFSGLAAYLALQVVAIVIALIVSLDLVEALGDLLGAPSLHARKLLSKVI